MNSRDIILQKIRSAMVPVPEPEPPVLGAILPFENPDTETMKKTFSASLTALAGKCFCVGSVEDAKRKFESLAEENGWERFSSSENPLLTQLFSYEFFHGKGKKKLYLGEAQGETDKKRLAEIPVSIAFPQLLLAETGTCVMLNRTAHERMNCYLTPSCVMVAKTSQLREHLQAAWEDVVQNTSDSAIRGEYVLVTGPSRTADIERVSILGVHGPKNLYVLLIQD